MLLAELGYFGSDYHLAIWLARISPIVLLVILLRQKERGHGSNLGDNQMVPYTGRFQLHDHLLGDGLLLRAMEEYGRPVLRTNIRTLTVQRGRVMDGEEDLQDL